MAVLSDETLKDEIRAGRFIIAGGDPKAAQKGAYALHAARLYPTGDRHSGLSEPARTFSRDGVQDQTGSRPVSRIRGRR
jgi:hypothetical protein